MGRVKKYTK
jgi:hypothetical protein